MNPPAYTAPSFHDERPKALTAQESLLKNSRRGAVVLAAAPIPAAPASSTNPRTLTNTIATKPKEKPKTDDSLEDILVLPTFTGDGASELTEVPLAVVMQTMDTQQRINETKFNKHGRRNQFYVDSSDEDDEDTKEESELSVDNDDLPGEWQEPKQIEGLVVEQMKIVQLEGSLFGRLNRLLVLTSLMIAFNVGIVIVCVDEYVKGSFQDSALEQAAADNLGIIGVIDCFFASLIISRNPYIERLWNRSYQQNVLYHAIASVLGISTCILHGMFEMILGNTDFVQLSDVNTSGLVAWIVLIVFLGTFSLEFFRRNHYQTFIMLHTMFFLVFVVFGGIHSWTCRIILSIACLLWSMDYLWYRRNKVQKKTEIKRFALLPGDVIKIEFEKQDFQYEAGQFVSICIPRLPGSQGLEFHAFALSSAPKDKYASIHIRAVGDWTCALQKLAIRCIEKSQQLANKRRSKHPTGERYQRDALQQDLPPMRVDGPFGKLLLYQPLYDYECVIFFAAGLGISSLQAVFNDYLLHHASSKQIEHVKYVNFLWSCRENNSICSNYARQTSLAQLELLHFQPNVLNKTAISAFTPQQIAVNFHLTQINKLRSKRLRRKLLKEDNHAIPRRPNYISIHHTRIDPSQELRALFKKAAVHRIRRIAVLCCGPPSFAENVANGVASCHSLQVKLDLHTDIFSI